LSLSVACSLPTRKNAESVLTLTLIGFTTSRFFSINWSVKFQPNAIPSNGRLARKKVIVKYSPTLDFDLSPAGQFEPFLPGYSLTEIVDEMQRLVLFESASFFTGCLDAR
jgi:hypothetical protein